jgi:Tfp pilus assembly protein PilN
MRAVNLVPKDYRRGALAGKGGETFSYFLIGGLVLVLAAVMSVVLTNNSVADRKAEIASLEQKKVDTQARADALQPYASFATLQQARTATISSLAQSRFDWERVMIELAQVIPADISLVRLSGTVLPEVGLDGEAALDLRSGIAGPALQIVGCAPDQTVVAQFIADIEDIDGVTRVAVQSSEKPKAEPSGQAEGDECRTRDTIPKFEIVAAFDAAPVPAGAESGFVPSVPAPPAAPDGGVGEAQSQQAESRQDVQGAKKKANDATNLVPGG